jgi:glucokinase
VVKLLRQSGRVIGEAISDAVSILNPSVIIIGGTLARTGDRLLSGIRELVYQRCLPLATRQLTVALSQADALGGLRGAAQLAIDLSLAPDRVDRILAERLALRPLRRRRQKTADSRTFVYR